jgi:hypothetical protein
VSKKIFKINRLNIKEVFDKFRFFGYHRLMKLIILVLFMFSSSLWAQDYSNISKEQIFYQYVDYFWDKKLSFEDFNKDFSRDVYLVSHLRDKKMDVCKIEAIKNSCEKYLKEFDEKKWRAQRYQSKKIIDNANIHLEAMNEKAGHEAWDAHADELLKKLPYTHFVNFYQKRLNHKNIYLVIKYEMVFSEKIQSFIEKYQVAYRPHILDYDVYLLYISKTKKTQKEMKEDFEMIRNDINQQIEEILKNF